jgi:single-stranded-DNA-specific exonuclease
VLVRAGLERLDATARPGLVALKEVAGVRGAVGVFEVGFQLAPRLNAAGRLETAEDALRLLLSADAEESRRIAGALDARNRERQDVERRIADEVVDRVRSRFDPGRDLVIVEGELHWHVGVVGIVASRVLREFHRPTIILGGDAEIWRGSGRSIPGFDLAAALRACADLLEKHGGHAMAAGLSIRPDRVPELRERLGRLAAERLAPDQLTPELRLDAALPLREITLGAVEELRALGPFGMGNPSVQLAVPGVRNARPPRRLKDRHWKLWLTDGAAEVEAVWWGAGERPAPQGLFDVAAAPETGEFRGRRYPLLRVLDWRPAA